MQRDVIAFFASLVPPWSHKAACAGSDTLKWFPEDDRPSSDQTVRYARSFCDRCTVRRECLEWAVSNRASAVHGIYGGTTGEERRQAMRSGDPDWLEHLLEGETLEAMA
jgi:WhiB family redox-sensing transcriptional regulator